MVLFMGIGYSNAQNSRGAKIQTVNKAQNKKIKAVVVGISTYSSPRLKLNFADSDAVLFQHYLIKSEQMQEDQILMLLDSNANLSSIYNGIRKLVASADSGERVYIYFAGHGDVVQESALDDEGYLLAFDAPISRNYLGGGAIDIGKLENYISQLDVKKKAEVVLVLDACHSGFDVLNGQLKTATLLGLKPNGAIRFLSSSGEQLSYEDETLKQGVFTWYLVKALSGAADIPPDNVITTKEIKDYVGANVHSFTKGKQTPKILAIDTFKQFVLITATNKIALQTINSKYGGINNNRQSRSTSKDSAAIEQLDTKVNLLIDAFNKAMQFANYYGNDSACFNLYLKLAGDKNNFSIAEQMTSILSDALITRSQLVLNELLLGKPEKQPIAVFISAENDLQIAKQILDADDPRMSFINLNLLYFQAYIIYLNSDYRQFSKAFDLLQQANSINNRAAYIHQLLALLYNYRNDFPMAVKEAEMAISLIPNWTYATNTLGNTYHNQGQYLKAIALHLKTLKSDSAYSLSWNNIGNAYLSMGSYKNAEYYYTLGIALDPKNPATEFHNLGLLYELRGLPNKSLQFYKQAYNVYKGTDVQNLLNLYSYYLNTKSNIDSALFFIQSALKISPNHAKALCTLGDFYAARVDRVTQLKADSFYSKAIEVNPFYSQAYADKAWLANKHKNRAMADYWFVEGIRKNPNQSAPYLNLGNFLATSLPDSAMKLYQTALSKDSFNYSIWVKIAALARTSKTGSEMIIYRQALQYFPENPQLWMEFGNYYYGQKMFQTSDSFFNLCSQADSLYSPAWASAAFVKLENKNSTDAVKLYQKAMLNEPENYSVASFSSAASHIAFQFNNQVEAQKYLLPIWQMDTSNMALTIDLAHFAALTTLQLEFWTSKLMRALEYDDNPKILRELCLLQIANNQFSAALETCNAEIISNIQADMWLKVALLHLNQKEDDALILSKKLLAENNNPTWYYQFQVPKYPTIIQQIIQDYSK